MGVISLQQNIEAEQSGEIAALDLIALRYTGENSSLATKGALNSQGKWPGTGPLNQGVWYFALVPDEGLGYLEARDDLDVVYADDTEAFAQALLSRNRLPSNVFGRGADLDLQDRVFDALGIEDPMEAGPVEAQLRGLAGEDVDTTTDGDSEDAEDTGRVGSLVDEYTRGELKEAAKRVREDTSDVSLNSSKTELAEYLAGEDDAEVNAALKAATDDEEGGDD